MENNEATWAISPNVRATCSQDGVVLLDIDKGLCYSLNAVGSRIWASLESSQHGINLDGIVNALAMHFKVPREQLEGDTAEYLQSLLYMGLVHHNAAVSAAKAAQPGG